MSLLLAPSLFLACTGTKPATHDSSADSATNADSGGDSGGDTDTNGDTGPVTYNGTLPDSSIPAPDFSAENMDESPRTKDDLIGHPTVIWFYPAAGTSG